MPGGDGTGPLGRGPMTGRGAGLCAGHSTGGFANPASVCGFGFGRGMGRGRGMGLGFRGGRWSMPSYGYQMPYAVPYGPATTLRQETESLQGQARYFENALAEINKRLAELETEAPKE